MRAYLENAFIALSAGLIGLFATAGILTAGFKLDGAEDEARLIGDWKGESIVVAKNTAAKDEVVIWHIAKAKTPGKLNVRADKIVNGKAINMGTLAFEYDQGQKAIICKYKQGVWKLSVDGNTMKGTLTSPNDAVFRRVSLERSSASQRP
jgi:hypothetical protein